MATALHIVGPTLLTMSAATLYTVPASTTFIVRLIHVGSIANATAKFTLSLGADANATRFQHLRSVDPYSEYDWSGFLAIPTGTVIQGYADTTTALVIVLSGTLET